MVDILHNADNGSTSDEFIPYYKRKKKEFVQGLKDGNWGQYVESEHAKTKPTNPEEEQNRYAKRAKYAVLGDALKTISEGVGLGMGATIEKRKPGNSSAHLDKIEQLNEDYRNKMDNWNYRDYLQKLNAVAQQRGWDWQQYQADKADDIAAENSYYKEKNAALAADNAKKANARADANLKIAQQRENRLANSTNGSGSSNDKLNYLYSTAQMAANDPEFVQEYGGLFDYLKDGDGVGNITNEDGSYKMIPKTALLDKIVQTYLEYLNNQRTFKRPDNPSVVFPVAKKEDNDPLNILSNSNNQNNINNDPLGLGL